MKAIFNKLVVMIVIATVSLWNPAAEQKNTDVIIGSTVDTQAIVSITPEITNIPEEPQITDIPDITSVPEETQVTDEDISDDSDTETVEPEITEAPDDAVLEEPEITEVPNDYDINADKYESGWNDGYAQGYSAGYEYIWNAKLPESDSITSDILNNTENYGVYGDGYADGYNYAYALAIGKPYDYESKYGIYPEIVYSTQEE